jgi:hypothetical protein
MQRAARPAEVSAENFKFENLPLAAVSINLGDQ